MGTLTRLAYAVGYAATALTLGVLVLAAWWMIAAVVLGEFGCDGLGGPCGSVGRFTSDYWWAIALAAAALSGLTMLPAYRRLIRDYSE